MIAPLMFEAPHVWKLIRNELIGNGGQPGKNGQALGGYVRQTEIKHNAEPGSYWYRFMRPEDPMISGGTAKQYYSTFTAVTEENILSTGADVTIPTGEAAASFGWICMVDLGEDGYLDVKKETVLKSRIPARLAWRQQNPEHYFVDLDTTIFAEANANIDFVTYNGNAGDRTGIVIPIMFRIATRSALNLERPIR